MDEVARLPTKDRADLFVVSGTGFGLTSEMIEKDFWVCWTLKRLFTLPNPPAGLLFKGGTSLSKVFHVIKRFSEDVDLSFNREGLGFGGANDPSTMTGKKRTRTLESLTATCRQVVREKLLPQLIDTFGNVLGNSRQSDWNLEFDEDDQDGATLLFRYPMGIGTYPGGEQAYIRPIIRLEIGARSDHWPAQSAIVSPYAAQHHSRIFTEPSCSVYVLAAERTFWEKITILHAWHHAPNEKIFPDRQSRHYYDVVQLYEHELGKAAIKNTSLLMDVARHKEAFFKVAWAKYMDAKPGTLRLVPSAHRLKELEADYKKMGEMFFVQPPNFDYLLNVLKEIEQQINNQEAG